MKELKEMLNEFKDDLIFKLVLKKAITVYPLRTHLITFVFGFMCSSLFAFSNSYAFTVFVSFALFFYLFYTTYNKVKADLIKEEEQQQKELEQ